MTVSGFFQNGVPVWPQGKGGVWNQQVGFYTHLKRPRGAEGGVLRIAAADYYRVWCNGQYVGFGPARTAHGYARVDEWALDGVLQGGANHLAIEVLWVPTMPRAGLDKDRPGWNGMPPGRTEPPSELVPADLFYGGMLRLELLAYYGEAQWLVSEIRAAFGPKARHDGTLWEHFGSENSCCHGFASRVAEHLLLHVPHDAGEADEESY